MGAVLLLIAALGAPPEFTPAGLVKLAIADAATLPPAERLVIRYASLNALPAAERAAFVKSHDFVANSTSLRARFARGVVVADSLVRVNLVALGWDRGFRAAQLVKMEQAGVKLSFPNERVKQLYVDIWESIGSLDPFFRTTYGTQLGWVDPKDDEALRALTGSQHPIVRADWLLTRAMLEAKDGGFYSQLLLLPPTEQDLYKRFTDLGLVNRENQERGGAVVESIVALHNRELQEIPSLLGFDQKFIWRTFDFAQDDVSEKNIFESLGGTAKHDGREIIGSLPNGLHWYYLADGTGRQVNVVPQNIAIDKRKSASHPIVDRSVFNAYKCISCHGPVSGIYPFQDRIKPTLLADGIGLAVIRKNKDDVAPEQERLEDYYLAGSEGVGPTGLETRVVQQQGSYENRIAALNGLTGPTNADAFIQYFDRFFWAPVTPEQAAREMGYPPDRARQVWRASGNPQLVVLSSGQPIRRAVWERAFADAMKAAVYPTPTIKVHQDAHPDRRPDPRAAMRPAA